VNSFGGGELTDYIIYFTRNLDPNSKLWVPWPQYSLRDPKALTFQDDPLFPLTIDDDNYRANPLQFAVNISLRHPI
jgi:acetylcholinesterase